MKKLLFRASNHKSKSTSLNFRCFCRLNQALLIGWVLGYMWISYSAAAESSPNNPASPLSISSEGSLSQQPIQPQENFVPQQQIESSTAPAVDPSAETGINTNSGVNLGETPTETNIAENTESVNAEITSTEALGESVGSADDLLSQLHLSYYGVFFGPSLKNPSAYQPTPNGGPDTNRPIIFKNFLGLTYQLSQQVGISGTAYWLWQPIIGQPFALQDPFALIYHNSLIHQDHFNIYADLRGHFPVTSASRETDLLFGLQTFQAYTYEIPDSRFTLGLYSSERINFFGKRGYGNAFEIYLSPNINYQLSPTVTLMLLYGIQGSQFYRQSQFSQDSVALQPGVNWDITPQLAFNPYLNIPTNGKVNLDTISMGLFVSWLIV